MDTVVDHYRILGLPSGEEGAKLTEKEIAKAYKSKALELHPDKRPDDPNAASNFQQLGTSYYILRDDKTRKLFDDLLRDKRDKERRQSQRDGKRDNERRQSQLDEKRRKMVSDLERREGEAFAADQAAAKAREEEAGIARKLKDEISWIRAMHAKKVVPDSVTKKESASSPGGVGGGDKFAGVDQEKVLKVSWDKVGVDYSAGKLRELFSMFGEVEDVVIKVSKKRGSALVVMATKEGAIGAICGSVICRLRNPLLVLPLKLAMAAVPSGAPNSKVCGT